MTKFVFVTYFIALMVSTTRGYSKECAIGPEYWCQSFENAQSCGSLQHCADTVWSYDDKYLSIDSSIECKWCQRILENTHKGLQLTIDDENSIVFTMTSTCKLLFPTDISLKCTSIVENYGTAVVKLLKNKRYATLCRLMNICTSEIAVEKPPIIGADPCTWGPAHWCSSLSNWRACGSTDHCSARVWSEQAIEPVENDNVCQYCNYIITKLRTILNENKTEINVRKWLTGACSMLKANETIHQCIQTMSVYAEEILVLIKGNIDSGLICHLAEMCKGAKVVQRISIDKQMPFDEESKVLCNVIVRATHDLHIHQQKSQHEIEIFLKDDCRRLSTAELIRKCEHVVDRHANEIYDDTVKNMAPSKICDTIDTFTDLQSSSSNNCDFCTFVLTTVKAMLDMKRSKDDILDYIDEHLCSHWDGTMKDNCKYVIDTTGKDLIDKIEDETQPLLLCTYFQVCLNEIIDEKSPIQENEMRSFLTENICSSLGIFEDSCYALIETDTERVLKTLVNNVDGEVLCQMSGVCSWESTFTDETSIKDDKDKCKRCITDFTRKKHIAEKLINHSSEFLHHFCGQLPDEDQCIQAVDDSIGRLLEFIQSLNPQDICIELHMCNETSIANIEHIQIKPFDNILSQEIIAYIEEHICASIGPLSNLCLHLMNSEGANLLGLISKRVDPHRVCEVMDICPNTEAFEDCDDKCECCKEKVDDYQLRLASFLQRMLIIAESICEEIPNSKDCSDVAAWLKMTIDEIIGHFNTQKICQSLTHCSTSASQCNADDDQCECCKKQITNQKNNFRTVINKVATTFASLCNHHRCHSLIRSNNEKLLNQIDELDWDGLCQDAHLCPATMSEDSRSDDEFYIAQRLSLEKYSEKICSTFEDFESGCQHIMATTQSSRFVNIYMALLENNSSFIDDDLISQTSGTCAECKTAIESSKAFWLNELESVRNTLLKTCESCSSKDQCQNFINQRFDNLKSYLDNINPEQFCQSIRLCSIALTVGNCSICVDYFQAKKDGLMKMTDRATAYFTDLCRKNANKQCENYVNKVHDSIEKSLTKYDPNETCTIIGFCTTDDTDSDINFEQYKNFLEDKMEKGICSMVGPFEALCKSVVRGDVNQIKTFKIDYDIKDLMKIEKDLTETLSNTEDIDDYTQDKCKYCTFRMMRRKRHTKLIGDKKFVALIQSCNYCPAKQPCRKYWLTIKTHFDTHIESMQPKRVCDNLGFCNKSSLCDSMGGFQEPCEELIESIASEVSAEDKIDYSNSTCILCEYVMNLLSNYISSESTEEEIADKLEKICERVPSVLHDSCRDYIENYSPAIISILLQDFNLSAVCRKLNLCTKQMKFNVTHLTKADRVTCGVCDYISTYLHFAAQRDSNERSLQHTLSSVCSHLSDEHHSKCQSIVLLLFPHIKQIELSLDEKNFCKKLIICEIPMSELQPAIPVKSVDMIASTPQCTLCHYVVSYLDAVLKANKSEQAIEEALARVCTILPRKERTECEKFIKTYGPVIAHLIIETADPETVCQLLGMCQSLLNKQTVADTQKPYTCAICQLMTRQTRKFADEHQNNQKDLSTIKKSCDSFTTAILQHKCYEFIEHYKTYVFQTLTNGNDPKRACQEIELCMEDSQDSLVTSSMINDSRCKDGGIEFWCASLENAKLCNAFDVCIKNVWKIQ